MTIPGRISVVKGLRPNPIVLGVQMLEVVTKSTLYFDNKTSILVVFDECSARTENELNLHSRFVVSSTWQSQIQYLLLSSILMT